METTTARWQVDLFLSEQEGATHAEARLHTGRPEPVRAKGTARLAPTDPVDVAEVGYELAAGRALVALGEALLEIAAADVDALNEV